MPPLQAGVFGGFFFDGWFFTALISCNDPVSLVPTGWARQKIYNTQNYRQIFSFQLLNNVVWKTVTTLFTEHFAEPSTKVPHSGA